MKTFIQVFTFLLCIGMLNGSSAQSKKQKDREAIKSMCGCFEVSFDFAETFNYADKEGYKPSPVKHSRGLEWAQLVVDENNEIVIQHLLVAKRGDEQFVIKHWRQDWLYENTDLYLFDADNKWKYVQLPKGDVKGQWTQKVYQVDDSPRYEGSATWVHVDGKSFWENTTTAPLPRREFSVRSDYNVTMRGNRHEITDFGWIHEQDNEKVIRKEGEQDFVLAEEKGINTYKRVDDARCQAAVKWWKENQDMWASVRQSWGNLFAQKKDIKLLPKVEDKKLFQHLFGMSPDTEAEKINEVISRFVMR